MSGNYGAVHVKYVVGICYTGGDGHARKLSFFKAA
jgi:hypothetical protein